MAWHEWLKKLSCLAGCACYLVGLVDLAHHFVTKCGSWDIIHIPAGVAVAALAGWAFHQGSK